MGEVDPDQSGRALVGETQQMMVIHPDNCYEQVAHRVAQGGRPEGMSASKVGRSGGLSSSTMRVMMTANTPSENASNRFTARLSFDHWLSMVVPVCLTRFWQWKMEQSNTFDLAAVHSHGGSYHPLCGGRHQVSHQVSDLFRFSETMMPTSSGNFFTASSKVRLWAGAHF
jgi:hypothetical protein